VRGTNPTPRSIQARRMSLRVAVTVVAVAMLTLSACAKSGGGAGDSSTIKLGMIVAETGPIAGAGKTFANGGRIAMQEINDGDLIGGGKKIELVEKEGSEDPAKSASVMAQLASDQSITGIVCCILSTVAGAAKPIANKQKVPTMLWGATDVNLAEPPYVFRTVTMPQPAN
jgi:branched-chain amino acid transport system substrate-binding protein